MLDETRLERLISGYFDQALAPEEKAELETMLLGSARARKIFIDQAEWHGLSREWALQSQAEQFMAEGEPLLSMELPALPVSQPPRSTQRLQTSPRSKPMVRPVPQPQRSAPQPPENIVPIRNTTLRWTAIAAGAAAVFGLAWKMLPAPAGSGKEAIVEAAQEKITRDDVALLAQAFDVEWEPGTTAYRVGSPLPKGELKIRRGTLRLDFYSGARVFLEGPATLDLLTQDLAKLDRGKLIAHVPPPAEGFTVTSGDLHVIDRGTEFGIRTDGGDDREVHVFQGEVELQGGVPADGKTSLVAGEACSIIKGAWTAFAADRRIFSDSTSMRHQADRATEANWQAWHLAADKITRIPGLVAHYDFEAIDPATLVLPNRAPGATSSTNGSVIGCELLTGRWNGKTALGFISTSDRVRLRLEGRTTSITLMASIRVDSLPQNHISLFSMSPDNVGEIHWKLDEHGRLLVGLRAAPQFQYNSWERLESPAIITRDDFGRWMFVATVIDGTKGEVRHYLNGEEIASGPLRRRPFIQLGLANIGNFDEAYSGRPTHEVRSLNGRIDEFAVFKRALTPAEIAAMK